MIVFFQNTILYFERASEHILWLTTGNRPACTAYGFGYGFLHAVLCRDRKPFYTYLLMGFVVILSFSMNARSIACNQGFCRNTGKPVGRVLVLE